MIIKDKINKKILESPFVKAVADIERKLVSLGCDLHIDCAEELIKDGSSEKDLWGFNIYPDGHLDFISLINIRPAQSNRKLEIENEEIRRKISEIVKKVLPE